MTLFCIHRNDCLKFFETTGFTADKEEQTLSSANLLSIVLEYEPIPTSSENNNNAGIDSKLNILGGLMKDPFFQQKSADQQNKVQNSKYKPQFLRLLAKLDNDLLKPYICRYLIKTKNIRVFDIISDPSVSDKEFMLSLRSILLHNSADLIGSPNKVKFYGNTLGLIQTRLSNFLIRDRPKNAIEEEECKLALSTCCLCYINGISGFDKTLLRALILDVVEKVGLENKKKETIPEILDVDAMSVDSDSEKGPAYEAMSPLNSQLSVNSNSIFDSPGLSPRKRARLDSDNYNSENNNNKTIKAPTDLNCSLASLAMVTAIVCDLLPSKKDENPLLWKLFIDKIRDFVIENLKFRRKLSQQDKEKDFYSSLSAIKKLEYDETNKFVEFILLLAIHLKLDHRKKVEQILLNNSEVVAVGVSTACRDIIKGKRRKVVIKTGQISNLAYLFNQSFSNEALTEFIISLPVTKNLSENMTENEKDQSQRILPIDLVIPVLSERQNLSKMTTKWVFDQILNTGAGKIPNCLIIMIESFVDACLKPPSASSSNWGSVQDDRSEGAYCNPFSESEILQNFNDCSTNAQCLFVYYALLYQDVLFKNFQELKTDWTGATTTSIRPTNYSEEFYNQLPISLVLNIADSSLAIKLTALILTYQPHLCPRPEDLHVGHTGSNKKLTKFINENKNLTEIVKKYQNKLKSPTFNIRNLNEKQFLEYNNIVPRELWSTTIFQLSTLPKYQRHKLCSYAKLINDPLTALKIDPNVLLSDSKVLTYVMSILSSLIQGSEAKFQMSLNLLDRKHKSKLGEAHKISGSNTKKLTVPTDSGKNDKDGQNGANKKEDKKDEDDGKNNEILEKNNSEQYNAARAAISACLMTQLACALQLLIESALQKGKIQCARIVARQMNQYFIQNRNILKLIIWQGFPIQAIDRFVKLIDCCHITVDKNDNYLAAYLANHDLERRCFVFIFISHLLEKHKTNETIKIAKLALNVLYTTIISSNQANPGRSDFAEENEMIRIISEPLLIKAIERICRNATVLTAEGIVLLGQIFDLIKDDLTLSTGNMPVKVKSKQLMRLVEDARNNLAFMSIK